MTIERDEDAIILAKEEQSVFVIVTNDTESDWTVAQLLSDSKSQQRVERGFSFLEDPQFFADSFFSQKTGKNRSTFDGNGNEFVCIFINRIYY